MRTVGFRDCRELLAVEGFIMKESSSNGIERFSIGLDDAHRTLVCFGDESSDGAIDEMPCLVAIFPGLERVIGASTEPVVTGAAEIDRP